MSDSTMKVGALVFTLDGKHFEYKDGHLRILVYPGWKKDLAVVTVQYPSQCGLIQSAGELPSVIESTLDSMRQELEQEVRRANKRLAAFNTQCSEILGKVNAKVNPTEPEAS